MPLTMSRRTLLSLFPAVAAAPSIAWASQTPGPGGPTVGPASSPQFPAHDPAVVKEMVTVAHGNVARVRELVGARPALARAAWDWGFGDWETALAASSHVGNREIAELLIANGAHPTIFSAAMLGQLDVVRAFVIASPGAQRIRGPHGITLLAHARSGGPPAAEVLKYLESLGDADPRYTNIAMSDAEKSLLPGIYAFGTAPTERFIVAANTRGDLTIKRDGYGERTLFHQGSRVFNPTGAEAVKIRFEPPADRVDALVIEDGALVVRARREVDGVHEVHEVHL
jgi:hypothetical protein